jgi:hypothetical protein
MKLYHGTTGRFLPRILRDGLQGRKFTKVKGHFDHTVQSNPEAVYLTDAYPWHFASIASKGQKKDWPGLILEIERDRLLPWLLCPDEDYLEATTRKQGPECGPGFCPTDWDLKARCKHYRKIAKLNPDLADDSLKRLGTCAYYGAIPWSAVTRYALIDWGKLHPVMRIRCVDSMVSMINYRLLAERHREFTRWFFDPDVDAKKMLDYSGVLDADLGKLMQQQIAHLSEVLQKRDGIRVHDTSKQSDPGRAVQDAAVALMEAAAK